MIEFMLQVLKPLLHPPAFDVTPIVKRVTVEQPDEVAHVVVFEPVPL